MDRSYYKIKIEELLLNQKPSIAIIYQYMQKGKIWKIVSKRCSICGTGFNKNNNNKFASHKCKKNNLRDSINNNRGI
jgi:hypothetical protein